METSEKGDHGGTDDPASSLVSEKQPILQWKAKKAKKRPRNELDNVLDESGVSTEHKNGDRNRDTDAAATGPLIIPVPQNTFQWKKPVKREEDSIPLLRDAETMAAMQALQDEVNIQEDGSPTINSSNGLVVPISGRDDITGSELQQYHRHLESLPAALEESAEAYSRVPIEQFGAALLRGMGWKEDDEDGTHKSREVAPRPHRLGLGAIPVLPVEPDVPSDRPRSIQQYQRDQQLKEQHASYRVQREQLRAADRQRTLQDGSIVQLNDGTRARILRLVGVPGLNMVQIQKENEAVPSIIKRNEMGGLVDREELERLPFCEKLRDAESRRKVESTSDNRSSNRDDERNRERKSRKDHNSRQEAQSDDKRKNLKKGDSFFSWVIPNIRVRIVTEKFGRRYYKEKGIITDITRESGITVQLTNMNGMLLHEIPERYLETALPKPGGNVIVLVDGSYRHARGRLLERDSRNGLVQLHEDMNCISVSLDDIAEWCGPLDDDDMD